MRTPPADAPNPFVPTLERARAAGAPLPDGEPIAQERWSALVVLATVLRRRSWKDEIYQHPNNVAHLPRGTPPEPKGFVPATHVVVEQIDVAGGCPDCARTPGLRMCRICRGAGVINPERNVVCSCGGSGKIPCPTCQRLGTASRIALRYYEDEPRWMRELYLPSHLPCHAPLFGLESAMEQSANIELDPPEDLRCHDLTGRAAGTAYRGGERTVRPTFHGHDFGDTIDRALDAIRALGAGGKTLGYDIRAYAWPLLRLQYPSPRAPAAPRDVVLYFDRGREMRVFEGEVKP
jgi:hypothetical protein